MRLNFIDEVSGSGWVPLEIGLLVSTGRGPL